MGEDQMKPRQLVHTVRPAPPRPQVVSTSSNEDRDYSGKLNIRIPKSLHQQLSEAAAKDGVSLNQYIVYKLSR